MFESEISCMLNVQSIQIFSNLNFKSKVMNAFGFTSPIFFAFGFTFLMLVFPFSLSSHKKNTFVLIACGFESTRTKWCTWYIFNHPSVCVSIRRQSGLKMKHQFHCSIGTLRNIGFSAFIGPLHFHVNCLATNVHFDTIFLFFSVWLHCAVRINQLQLLSAPIDFSYLRGRCMKIFQNKIYTGRAKKLAV